MCNMCIITQIQTIFFSPKKKRKQCPHTLLFTWIEQKWIKSLLMVQSGSSLLLSPCCPLAPSSLRERQGGILQNKPWASLSILCVWHHPKPWPLTRLFVGKLLWGVKGFNYAASVCLSAPPQGRRSALAETLWMMDAASEAQRRVGGATAPPDWTNDSDQHVFIQLFPQVVPLTFCLLFIYIHVVIDFLIYLSIRFSLSKASTFCLKENHNF